MGHHDNTLTERLITRFLLDQLADDNARSLKPSSKCGGAAPDTDSICAALRITRLFHGLESARS